MEEKGALILLIGLNNPFTVMVQQKMLKEQLKEQRHSTAALTYLQEHDKNNQEVFWKQVDNLTNNRNYVIATHVEVSETIDNDMLVGIAEKFRKAKMIIFFIDSEKSVKEIKDDNYPGMVFININHNRPQEDIFSDFWNKFFMEMTGLASA